MPVLYYAGFETGNFSECSSALTHGGGVLSVTPDQPYVGINSARFEVLPTIEWAAARCSFHVVGQAEIYARAYFLVARGLPLPAGFFDLISFESSIDPSDYIAGARISLRDGADRWRLVARDGTEWIGADGGIIPATPEFICVELHIIVDPVNGVVELFVNGNLEAQITGIDTSAFPLERVRFGITHKPSSTSSPGAENMDLLVYTDECVVSTEYIGLEYLQVLAISTGLGGTTDPVPGVHQYAQGITVPVLAVPTQGYSFVAWDLDGFAYTENPINILMDQDHTLNAVFEETIIPPSPITPIAFVVAPVITGVTLASIKG